MLPNLFVEENYLFVGEKKIMAANVTRDGWGTIKRNDKVWEKKVKYRIQRFYH